MKNRSLGLAFSLIVFCAAVSMAGGNPAFAAEKYGCSKTFRAFKSAINAHDKHLMKYAAFAKGKAFTITGMKGCGWSHGQKTQAQADRKAIASCRKAAKNPDKCYIALRYSE
ncbi:hypothetical protein LP7551_02709 [Roseibium album]|nr:hypothetical protein LP7551_02709 [Roseibium album]